MLKAVIFDYNGVLVDDLKIHEDSYLLAAKELGVPLSPKIVSQDISYAPAEKRRLWFSDIPDELWNELLNIKTRYYFQVVEMSDIVFRDVEDVLTSLSARYTLALISNTTRKHFDRVFPRSLAGLFRETLFADEVERPKPHPDPLIQMLNRLRISKDHCCYVGDSVLDIRMAKTVGISILAVATGHNAIDELRSAGADDVLTSLSALKKKLMNRSWVQGSKVQRLIRNP